MPHPTTANPSLLELVSWANCSVPGCENKVTHKSNKCFPHTYGWEAVRRNLRKRLALAEVLKDKDTISHVSTKLKEIENRV